MITCLRARSFARLITSVALFVAFPGLGIGGTIPVVGPASASSKFYISDVSWTTRAPMPTARAELGVAAASDGKIYAIGGYAIHNNGAGVGTVEAYDPSTNKWTTRSSMPTPRSDLGVVAAANGLIYAIGGTDNAGGSLSTVEAYDPTTDTWATKASMPTTREDFGVATVNGTIYVIGGDSGPYLSTVEAYDTASNTWTTKKSMPTVRHKLAAIAWTDGTIYAIGGYNGSFLGTVERYFPATNSWTSEQSMPTPREALGLAAPGNKNIYAIAGNNSYSGVGLTTVEEYDPPSNSWRSASSLSTGRQGPGVTVATNGKIYAVGGLATSLATLSANEEGTVTFPDLAVIAMSNPPATAAVGTSFAVTDTTSNLGTVAADQSTTGYFLSLDQQKNAGDVSLSGKRVIPALNPTRDASGTVNVTIPTTTPPGLYYVLGCADSGNVVPETNEANNCLASSGQVQVGP
jgi:N-acetylneuraminic acid mutarotase